MKRFLVERRTAGLSGRKRVAVVLAGAALVGVLIGAGALAVVSWISSRNAGERTQVVVSRSVREAQELSRRFGSARKLAEVQSVARAARTALRRSENDLATIRDAEASTARAAEDLVSADARLLTVWSSLASVKLPRRADADRISREIDAAERLIREAADSAREAGLQLPGRVSEVQRNDDRGTAQFTKWAKTLDRWRQRVARIRSDRRSRLLVLNSYERSLRSHFAAYDKARAELQEWIDGVDSHGATYSEAYDFLADAYGDRERARQAVASIQAPAALRSAHQQIVAAITRARDALDSASSGIADYQFDFDGEYDSYKDTPGWSAFRSESDGVGAQYSSAVASWQQRLNRIRKSLRSAPLPKHPKV